MVLKLLLVSYAKNTSTCGERQPRGWRCLLRTAGFEPSDTWSEGRRGVLKPRCLGWFDAPWTGAARHAAAHTSINLRAPSESRVHERVTCEQSSHVVVHDLCGRPLAPALAWPGPPGHCRIQVVAVSVPLLPVATEVAFASPGSVTFVVSAVRVLWLLSIRLKALPSDLGWQEFVCGPIVGFSQLIFCIRDNHQKLY